MAHSQFIRVVSVPRDCSVVSSHTGSGHNHAVSTNKKDQFLLFAFFRGRHINRFFELTH